MIIYTQILELIVDALVTLQIPCYLYYMTTHMMSDLKSICDKVVHKGEGFVTMFYVTSGVGKNA